MGRIILFEDRNFMGRFHEAMSDCPDLSSMISRCHSIRVESGNFMIYNRPNFMGNQMLLRRGEYPDIHRMMSMEMMGRGSEMMFGDSIRSCRMIPPYRGSCRMRVYERENFEGQMMEVMDDVENVMDRMRMSDIMSAQVMEGHFIMYEQPSYRGRMVYVMPGEHRSLRSMSNISRIGSIRRIMESM